MSAFRSIVLALLCAACADEPDAGPPARFDVSMGETTLSNGLTVFVLPDHRLPIVATAIGVGAGALTEAAGRNGYAHLLEHMIFGGSHRSGGPVEFAREVGAIGAVHNAAVTADSARYYYVVEKTRADWASWPTPCARPRSTRPTWAANATSFWPSTTGPSPIRRRSPCFAA
jgi:hypothetical protein